MKCVYKIALDCHFLRNFSVWARTSTPFLSSELGNSCPQRKILWLMLGAGKYALFSPEAFCHSVSFCDSRMMHFEVELPYSRAYCHFNHSSFKTSTSRVSLFQCNPLSVHPVWSLSLGCSPPPPPGPASWVGIPLRRASVLGLMLSCH